MTFTVQGIDESNHHLARKCKMVNHYGNRYLIYVHSEYLRGKFKCVFITAMGNKRYFLRKEKNSQWCEWKNLTHKHKNNGRKKW